MKRPLFLTTILFCLSIIIYKVFGFDIFVVSLILSVAILCLFIKKLSFIVIAAVIIFCSFFSVENIRQKIDVSKEYSGEKYTVYFTVVSDQINTTNAKCVSIKTDNNNEKLSNTKYNLYYRDNNLYCGQKIKAEVKFFAYDLDKEDYNLSKGMYGSFWLCNVYDVYGFDSFYSLLGNTRHFIKTFLGSYLSQNSAKTLTAIMLGDKSVLDTDFALYVKRAGVSHIMAVSGLHLSVILGFLFLVFARALRNKYIRFLFSIVSVVAVSGVCGFTPSVIRAGTMFVIFAFASLIKRDTDTLTVISFAVLIILMSSPMLLFNISFQMSVLAIIAVMYITPFLFSLIKDKFIKSKTLKAFVLAVLVSVMANIFTMPVAILNFGYISIASVVTNIFISLPTMLIIELAMGGILLCFVPLLPKIIMRTADYLTLYINAVIEFFGKLKYSAICVPKYFCIFPILIMTALVVLKIIYERRAQNASGI